MNFYIDTQSHTIEWNDIKVEVKLFGDLKVQLRMGRTKKSEGGEAWVYIDVYTYIYIYIYIDIGMKAWIYS